MSKRIFSKQVHPQLATSWREQVLRPLRDDDRSNDREHDVLLEACQTYFLPGENLKLF